MPGPLRRYSFGMPDYTSDASLRRHTAGLGAFPAISALATLLALAPCGAEPVPGLSQQMQLDRTSEQELWWLQRPPGGQPTAPSLDQRHTEERVHRRQRLEQELLQEQQRRQLLWQDQRSRVWNVPPWQQRLNTIRQQRQFQLEQRRQLNRFGAPHDPLAR